MQGSIRSKFIGCLIGSALGDAIGELAFRFRSRSRLDAEVQNSELLRYTDDTAMAIGVAQCLAEMNSIDPEKLGQIFHRNYKKEPWRGYASGPPSIFARVETSGVKYAEAASGLFAGTGSFGNGSAMRVAPVGLFFYDSNEIYESARRSALPTHSHALAVDGAAVQAKAVALAVQSSPAADFHFDRYLGEIESFAGTPEFREKIRLIRRLLSSGVSEEEAARTLGKSVAVHESLPFAIYSFARYPESFEKCIYCAILNGGDRDTLGAMAGAISGAYLGVDSIPKPWLEKLEGRDLFENLAESLLSIR
jgi:poly(ADP-ribose) glycohydrolase ARH3